VAKVWFVRSLKISFLTNKNCKYFALYFLKKNPSSTNMRRKTNSSSKGYHLEFIEQGSSGELKNLERAKTVMPNAQTH
jgi:hypothetical protein